MKLIIGGYSQGKLNYTLRKIGEKEYRICDGTLPEYTKIDTAEINIIKSDSTNTISHHKSSSYVHQNLDAAGREPKREHPGFYHKIS